MIEVHIPQSLPCVWVCPLVRSQGLARIITDSRTFSLLPKTPKPTSAHLFPQPLVVPNCSSSGSSHSSLCIEMESCIMWPFVSSHFYEHDVFKVHSRIHISISFLLYGQIIFQCVDLVYSFTHWWIFQLLLFLENPNNIVVYSCVSKYFLLFV